jgi:hypothetical protein
MCSRISFLTLLFIAVSQIGLAQDETYAEKLGWPKGAKLLIMHVDDAGMSHDSNLGTIKAIEEGAANSFSVMMPCPWVPEILRYIEKNPETDAGLHLTLNAEWDLYRWGPLAGKPTVPGLVDEEGAMWPQVEDVVEHATADEVEKEIRAQVDRALAAGFRPTHLDSHMGTIFGSLEFVQRYIKVGMETQIPIMFPGGHCTYIAAQNPDWPLAMIQQVAKQVWDSGLPVLDDLHNYSYEWKREDKVESYVEIIRSLKPGVTMMINHCTDPTENFPVISGSTQTRLGDLEAMLHRDIKKAIEEEGIIMTTWRELKERRDKVAKN